MAGEQDLVELAVSSGLVDAARAERCRASTPNAGAAIEALVAERSLTRWQAAQLKSGHTQGFFLGRYKLLEPLEHTAVGNVYHAVESQSPTRHVALIPLGGAWGTAAAFQHVEREAPRLQALQHESILRLLEAGRQGEQSFLAYELAPGGTLAKYLTQHGRLPLAAAARVARESSAALEHARQQGLVHGLFDPTAIWLTREQRCKLAFVGLIGPLGRAGAPHAAAKPGAPHPLDYRPPESADAGKPVDARGDVYALGCVLYHCLTGEPPFAQAPVEQKAAAHAQTPPPALAARCPELPFPAAEWIEKRLLAKRPEDRPQTPGEVAAQLGVFAAAQPDAAAQNFDAFSNLLAMDAMGTAVQLPSGALPLTEVTKTQGHRPGAASGADGDVLGNLRDSKPWLIPVAGLFVVLAVLSGIGYIWKVHQDRLARAASRDLQLPQSVPAGDAAVAPAPAPVVETAPAIRGPSKIVAAGSFAGHPGTTAESVAITPDGTIAISGGGDATLRIWNVDSGEEIGRLHGHEGRINTVAISHDGSLLASGGGQIQATDDGSVRMWDMKTRQQIAIVDSFRDLNVRELTREVTFSPDGLRVLSGHTAARLILSGARSGRLYQRFNGHIDDIRSVTFKPNGEHFASSSNDKTIRIWTPEKASPIRTIDAQIIMHAIRFLPDNVRLVSGGADGILRLWDTDAGAELRSYRGHTGSVQCVVIASGGTRMISGGEDGKLILWDIESGRQLQTIPAHSKAVRSVSMSADDLRLVSCSTDGSVKRWTLEQ